MKLIRPSEISGKIQAPPSKSLMIRATASALLSSGATRIRNPSVCDDARAALDLVERLGAGITRAEDAVVITAGANPVRDDLNCRESGLCMRMFAPIAALSGRETTMTGGGSLTARPMGFMEEALRALGVSFRATGGHAPLSIRGPLAAGKIRIDGSLSSQFLTGLLTALPLCPGDSEIRVDHLKSKPYAAMTMAVLSSFGVAVEADRDFEFFRIPGRQSYRCPDYAIEGDWSGASFILAAAALCGEATVANLRRDSLQADRLFLDALDSAGALIDAGEDSVSVRRAELKSFEFDATDCPDLFPPLAALALRCQGTSRILGAGRLRHKESDRASILIKELSGLGARIVLRGDALEIEGPVRIRGGRVDSHNDHRIAMAGALAGLLSDEGVEISGPECVGKSYPDYFEDLKALGGDVT
jgi:3-phosphoshikimate 1-carboxyvinyltransferase